MNDLSYTQEFYLCATDKKGKVSSTEKICLAAGGISELLNGGYIKRDEKQRLIVAKPWDDTLPYIKPIYDTIATLKKPHSSYDVLTMFSGSKKLFNELNTAIGSSLVAADCATELEVKGRGEGKSKYVPKEEAVKKIIEKIRAELLEDGAMSDETVCLAALLDTYEIVLDYFSKVERESVKARIKEVYESEESASITDTLEEILQIPAMLVVVMSVSSA